MKKLQVGTAFAALSVPVFALAATSAEAIDSISAALDEVKPFGWAVVTVLAGLMVFKFIKRVL